MATLLEIDNATYAAGLFWQTLTSVRNHRSEVKQLSSDLNMDRACVIPFPSLQVGFASSETVPGRAASLAARLAGSRRGSWIGVYSLGNDRFYYIALLEDVILPRGDQIGDQATIEKRMLEDLSMPEARWDGIYAPPGFAGVEDATAEKLEHLLMEDSENKGASIRPVHVRFTLRRLLSFAAAVLLMMGFSLWYFGSANPPPHPEPRSVDMLPEQFSSEAQLQNQLDALADTPGETVEIIDPWMNRPTPSRFLKACQSSFARGAYSLAGWRLSRWVCERDAAMGMYVRADISASIQSVKSIAGKASVHVQGDKVVVRDDLSKSHAPSSTENRDPKQTLQAKWSLQDRIQQYGWKVSFEEHVTPDPSEQTPSHRRFGIAWEGDIAPFSMALDDIPGFYITRIEQTYPAGGLSKWNVKGDLYVQR